MVWRPQQRYPEALRPKYLAYSYMDPLGNSVPAAKTKTVMILQVVRLHTVTGMGFTRRLRFLNNHDDKRMAPRNIVPTGWPPSYHRLPCRQPCSSFFGLAGCEYVTIIIVNIMITVIIII